MMDDVLTVAKLNLEYGKKLVADLSDEQMCLQPAAGMNHAAWVIGHLTFVGDSMIKVWGENPGLPREWVELFNLASKPTDDRTRYPAKAVLTEAYVKAYERLMDAVKGAPAEAFQREFPNPKLRGTLPTVGVAMVHILTSHHALHLGQLSAWRRAQGLPGVF